MTQTATEEQVRGQQLQVLRALEDGRWHSSFDIGRDAQPPIMHVTTIASRLRAKYPGRIETRTRARHNAAGDYLNTVADYRDASMDRQLESNARGEITMAHAAANAKRTDGRTSVQVGKFGFVTVGQMRHFSTAALARFLVARYVDPFKDHGLPPVKDGE